MERNNFKEMSTKDGGGTDRVMQMSWKWVPADDDKCYDTACTVTMSRQFTWAQKLLLTSSSSSAFRLHRHYPVVCHN